MIQCSYRLNLKKNCYAPVFSQKFHRDPACFLLLKFVRQIHIRHWRIGIRIFGVSDVVNKLQAGKSHKHQNNSDLLFKDLILNEKSCQQCQLTRRS